MPEKVHVLTFAYRGYTNSTGKPSDTGLEYDAKAIMLLVERIQDGEEGYKDVFLYGRSLGGAVATYAAMETGKKTWFKGLILENTFSNVADAAQSFFPGPLRPFRHPVLGGRWETAMDIEHVEAPILIVATEDDAIVSWKQSEKI